jgi:7-keto-8-aminopelargonate synthetase-like enzyme
MFEIIDIINQELSSLKSNGNYRHFLHQVKDDAGNPFIKYFKDGTWVKAVNYCSNDYLGMSTHPEVIQAFVQSGSKYGVSSGGTRNISGTTECSYFIGKNTEPVARKRSSFTFWQCLYGQSRYFANIGEKDT